MKTESTTHQFFYFYHAGIIIVEVVGIIMSILQQWNPRIVLEQPWLAVPEFVIGIFSLVMFVCTIVAFFLWRKRRYAGYTYLTPAVYLGLSIVMGVLGTVWSLQTMSEVIQATQTNSDPLAVQQMMLSQTLPTWLYLSSYLTAGVTLIVALCVLMKFKRSVTTEEPATSPTAVPTHSTK